jgi:hypothetical protein
MWQCFDRRARAASGTGLFALCRRATFDFHNRSGRSPHWLKFKNPNAPAVKREAEEDWGALSPGPSQNGTQRVDASLLPRPGQSVR